MNSLYTKNQEDVYKAGQEVFRTEDFCKLKQFSRYIEYDYIKEENAKNMKIYSGVWKILTILAKFGQILTISEFS